MSNRGKFEVGDQKLFPARNKIQKPSFSFVFMIWSSRVRVLCTWKILVFLYLTILHEATMKKLLCLFWIRLGNSMFVPHFMHKKKLFLNDKLKDRRQRRRSD